MMVLARSSVTVVRSFGPGPSISSRASSQSPINLARGQPEALRDSSGLRAAAVDWGEVGMAI